MKSAIYALCLSIIFFLSFCQNVRAEYLALPASIANKAVYYKKSQQLENWSCGYNALFRACELEGNSYRHLNNFNALCLPYVAAQRLRPTDGAQIHMLQDLGQKLGLQKVQGLMIDERTTAIVPIYNGLIKYTYNSHAFGRDKEQAKEKALTRIRENIIAELKLFLTQRKAATTYVHFICHVWANNEDHAILVSLVQNSYGNRSLYIFDNLNGIINEYCLLKSYIDYLITEFTIDTLQTHAQALYNNKNIAYINKLINTIDIRARMRS